MKRKLALLAGVLGAAVVAQGAVMTSWSAATTVTSTTDISLEGTQVYGGSWGSTEQTVNVSGEDIVFQDFAINGTAGGDAYTSSTAEYDGALDWYTGDTGSTAFNTVMDSLCFRTAGSGNTRLYLTNLTIGQEYQIQLFASDDRNFANRNKTQLYRAVDGAPTSETFARDPATSVIGTFTADAVTQNIDVYAISDTETILNAMNLRAIPEPATLGLITAFGGSILFVRRFMQM
jgi:predicted peptidase